MVVAVMVFFGIPSLKRNPVSIVQSARLIYLGRFIQRIDIFFAFFWMIGICLKYTILFYAANVGLTRLFKLPYRKPFLIPLGLSLLPSR